MEKVAVMTEHEEDKIYEALSFIQINQPRDMIEVYHFLNMFYMEELLSTIMRQVNYSLDQDVMESFAKLAMKACGQYSKGMIALRTYRNRVNYIKN